MNQRLHEIDQAIEALTAAQARRKQLTAQMDELYRQRCERQARVEETARIFRKEQDEVDLLKKGGFGPCCSPSPEAKKGGWTKSGWRLWPPNASTTRPAPTWIIWRTS